MARNIGVIGMGYVGLTLTAALARKGFVVHGVDVQPAVIDSAGVRYAGIGYLPEHTEVAA